VTIPTPGSTQKKANREPKTAPRILVADDDKRIRIVFRLTLERLGVEVVEAENGNEAWKKITEDDIDVAIMDMKMPGLHGMEVLAKLAEARIELPVVVCSAFDQLKDEQLVQSFPRLRYLVKPVNTDQLLDAVRELAPDLSSTLNR
jgi:CheY-like chemotaxis protein